MKQFQLLIFIGLLSNFKSHSQTCPTPTTPCLNTPYNGNLNLKNALYSTFTRVGPISYAIQPISLLPITFGDVKYVMDENYVDGSNCDVEANAIDSCFNDAENLIYDVYYPSTYSNFETCPLPAVILFHAGGYLECSNYRQPGIRVVCEELAKRGFVAFSVEYRAGRIKDPDIRYTSVQQELAVYRACQDARGAIRSIIKRQNNETSGDNWGDPYRINSEKIFVGGFSAGGVAAMNAAWYTNSMTYQVFPSTGATIQQVLTGINADFYYGESTGALAIEYQSKIKATAAMWTAVPIPISFDDPGNFEWQFFNSSLLKPHIGFVGKQDDVFPYPDNSSQHVKFSPTSNVAYNTEDWCIRTTNGNYTLEGNAATDDLINGSCLNMRNILNHYTIPNELYVDCSMHHGLSSGTYGFEGDFGTSATTSNQASAYIAQRMATFFQAVLNNNAGSIGTDFFPNCENTRQGCSTLTTSCVDCTN